MDALGSFIGLEMEGKDAPGSGNGSLLGSENEGVANIGAVVLALVDVDGAAKLTTFACVTTVSTLMGIGLVSE